MTIQWFPGHMHKARKELKQRLPDMDMVIEVLDARIPFSSQNPMLKQMASQKPTIKILNKFDLADPNRVKEWQNHLEKEENIKTLTVSSKHPDTIKNLIDLARKICPQKKDHQFISALIMGIPNVGKSTIINKLADRTIAKTGNEPAVTKHQQRIQIAEDLILFDTPGMLWPKIRHDNWGLRLAVTGAIKETAMSHEDCAFYLAGYLRKHYPEVLQARYDLQQLESDDYALLEQIGARRGCNRSGGFVDLHKVSSILVHDYRSGNLGDLCLETPQEVVAEELEAQKLEEIKLAKKLARQNKKRRKN